MPKAFIPPPDVGGYLHCSWPRAGGFRLLTEAATGTPLTPALSPLRGEGAGRRARAAVLAPLRSLQEGRGLGEVRANPSFQLRATSFEVHGPC